MLAGHLGGSLAAESAATGVNYDWWNEFLAQAAGVGQSFVPAIIGFAAVLKNLSGVADAERLPIVIAAAVSAHARAVDVPRRRRAGSAGARSRHRRRRVLRGLRRLLRPVHAAGRHRRRRSTGSCSPGCIRGCSTTCCDLLTRDLTVERTAFVYRVAALRAVLRRSLLWSTWSSTTPRFAPSSRIGAA